MENRKEETEIPISHFPLVSIVVATKNEERNIANCFRPVSARANMLKYQPEPFLKLVGTPMGYHLSSVSIIIPTLNSEKTLGLCLESIAAQDYPRDKIEIIIADGGSTDNTFTICEEYRADKILENPYGVEEKGRVIGINNAKNTILGFIDADNILPSKNWLKKIVLPFQNEEGVVAAEPLFYSAREKDSAMTKYVALIGGDDPVAIYLGNYDRFCWFKYKWTDAPVHIREENNNYIIVSLDKKIIPPMGANGFFIKKDVLREIKYDPFLHTDIIYRLVKAGFNDFAKVKIGVIHLQDKELAPFISKKRRRIRRLLQNEISREYTPEVSKAKILKYAAYFMLILPLLIDVFRGYRRKPDQAWLLHVVMCPLTVLAYAMEFLEWWLTGKER